MNKCPLVLSPQHSINSSKKLIDSAIYKTYQRFFTQLSQRLVSAETASTATFGVDDVFTEFDARAAASKGTGFWSLRQTIAFIVAGILGYRPGNNSNNIKKKTSSSLDPHQQDTCSTDWVSSASYYTVCDDKLLRIAAPLLFHLRKDAAWAVRAVVLDLALDYVSAIHSIQGEIFNNMSLHSF